MRDKKIFCQIALFRLPVSYCAINFDHTTQKTVAKALSLELFALNAENFLLDRPGKVIDALFRSLFITHGSNRGVLATEFLRLMERNVPLDCPDNGFDALIE